MSEPRPAARDAAVAARMSKQKRRDTAPEMAIRRELHRLGYRYRVNAPLPGMPRRRADLLFTRRKVAVFVDGCFWHACPLHSTAPANNAAWWTQKLGLNVARDRDTDHRLADEGWRVVRIWEHVSTQDAVATIVAVLRSN